MAGVHAMTGTVIRVARCPVCRSMFVARRGEPGCGPCVARLGRRFMALAAKFRDDPEFQRAVLARMSPRMLEMLYIYFINPPLIAPKTPRRGPFGR